MRILIVEDSDSIRRMLEALVSARADDIVAVSTGQEGLDKAFAAVPDVVLLDLNLPGLYNGVEVCARLRADPKTRKVPVFVITANADEPTRLRVMQAGATHFFPKPFSPKAILNAIDEVRRLSIVPAAASPTGAPSAFSHARTLRPSQPSPPRPESSGEPQAGRETSRPPGSEPPKRT